MTLAKRLVACKGWRWMPGMLIHYTGLHCFDFQGFPPKLPETQRARLLGDSPSASLLSGDPFPDLTDPATLGCLLALVREAWGMPTGITVSYSSDDGLWGVSWSGATHGGWCGRGKTEAEALVAALEDAP